MARRRSNHRCDKKFCLAIKKLLKLKPNDRIKAIRFANDKFIRKFCSETQKLRYKKFYGRDLNMVKKHRKVLRKITNKSTSIDKKRNLLQQKGGILPFLLPLLGKVAMAAAPFVISKIGKAISKRS